MVNRTELTIQGVDGFFEKFVTKIGTGAKVDCPKRYLGRAVYVVIRRPGAKVIETATRRREPTQP